MVDLFAGLGGWAEGGLAEGYDVIGFDIERHEYGDERYPGQLVLQDVRTLHGSQFRDAALIVASPPCQEFSYMAMPWQRAKQIARALRGEDEFPAGYRGSRTIAELTALFDACFRIQREACEAAGRHIPLVVENVKGAQPWVGRAKWSFGSYFLWGDVPALMPVQKYHQRQKVRAGEQWNINRPNFTGTLGWDPDGRKNPGLRFDGSGKSFQSESVARHFEGRKAPANTAWFNDAPRTPESMASMGSKSPARKAASARIAKIPFALSSWIARTYKPPETIGRAILEAMEEA